MKEAQEQTEKTSVFKEWADATTAHGFVDFCRSKTVVGKVIWFVLILISFTLMVYQLYQIGNDYSKNEWITTTKEQSPDNGMRSRSFSLSLSLNSKVGLKEASESEHSIFSSCQQR